jgi:hypothetical protein
VKRTSWGILTALVFVMSTRVVQVYFTEQRSDAWWSLEALRWTVTIAFIAWLYEQVTELRTRLDAIRDLSLRELAGDAEDEDVLRSDW